MQAPLNLWILWHYINQFLTFNMQSLCFDRHCPSSCGLDTGLPKFSQQTSVACCIITFTTVPQLKTLRVTTQSQHMKEVFFN